LGETKEGVSVSCVLPSLVNLLSRSHQYSLAQPASLCGIVGLKPTFGLVPYTGVLSSDPGVDHVGPMSKTVYDVRPRFVARRITLILSQAALLLEAIAGYDGIDDRQLGAPLPANIPKYAAAVLEHRKKGIKGLKIGLLREGFAHKSLDKAVDESVRAAIAKFVELGATVEEVSVPLHAHTDALCHVLNKFASAGTRSGRQVGRRGLYVNCYWDQLLPWTQEKFDKAKYHVTGTAMSA
jgi:amidase